VFLTRISFLKFQNITRFALKCLTTLFKSNEIDSLSLTFLQSPECRVTYASSFWVFRPERFKGILKKYTVSKLSGFQISLARIAKHRKEVDDADTRMEAGTATVRHYFRGTATAGRAI